MFPPWIESQCLWEALHLPNTPRQLSHLSAGVRGAEDIMEVGFPVTSLCGRRYGGVCELRVGLSYGFSQSSWSGDLFKPTTLYHLPQPTLIQILGVILLHDVFIITFNPN